MSEHTDHVEIINRFGVQEFADALGIEYETARRMRDRRRINPERWERLIEACRARKWYDVTAESLLRGLEHKITGKSTEGNAMAASAA